MRILGAILLIAGFFLCLTIVWAAIGFLAMGLGLICLLIAERRQKQIREGTLPQMSNLQQEAAKATPEQKVTSSAEAPELSKAEQHPPYLGDFRSPALSQRSSSEEEDRHAADKGTVPARRRSHDMEGRSLIAQGHADVSRSANVTKSSRKYAGLGATTAISVAASPETGGPPAVPKNANPGARPGSVASSGRSNRPLASPSSSAAATRATPSMETPPSRQRAEAASRPASHSGDTALARAGEKAGTTTSEEGEPTLRRPVNDAEDVRNLAELLSKIAERGT